MNMMLFLKKIIILTVFLSFSAAIYSQNDSIPTGNPKSYISFKKTYNPAPVVPFRDTLFYINAEIGTFTPQERAAAITERIRTLSKELSSFQIDSIAVLTEEEFVYIAYHDFIIMTVTTTDAKLKGRTQLHLAQDYQKIIKESIIQRQKDMGWITILWRIALIVLIVAVQYFLIKIVNWLFRKISAKIERLKGTKIKTIKIRTYKLMDEEKTTKFILFLVKIVRYLIIGLTLYLSIPLAFSVFPATRGIATVLFGYILTPFKSIFYSVIIFIPNLITIIVIIFVFRYLLKGIRFLAGEIARERLVIKGFYADWAHPTYNIVKILLYAFMFVIIFPYLPYNESAVFKGVSIFIGVVFSLGSSSIINNVVSGLVLTYMRPFKIGDRIKIGDIVGNVTEKTPFVTRIRTPKNEEITIPNSNIMSAQTFNYSQSARTYGLILHTEMTFGYDTPWRQVHELLLNAAKRTPNVQENPKPFIFQTALNDFYVEYQLNVYVVDADKMAQIYSDLHQNVQDVFNEAGVEIMSPHYQAYRDGNRVAVPASYLSDNYQAPSFQVKIEK